MALTSYNGWPASSSAKELKITPLIFKGESFAPGVPFGDVHQVFSWLIADLDALVEPVWKPGWHAQDDWGWAFRQNRNANNLSCHASGTAIDYNATRHGNGVPTLKSWTAAQAARIRNLLKVNYRGLIRWGGDFTGTPDSMHFEIIGTPGQLRTLVRDVLAFGGAGQLPPKLPVGTLPRPNPNPQPWLMLRAVRSRPMDFQRWYNVYPFSPPLLPVISPIANNFGPQSVEALKKVQKRYGLVADGIDGPLTKKLLWDLGYRVV